MITESISKELDQSMLSALFALEHVDMLLKEGITTGEFIRDTPCSICGNIAGFCLSMVTECKEVKVGDVKYIIPKNKFICEKCCNNHSDLQNKF
jgi:hypothetical protein